MNSASRADVEAPPSWARVVLGFLVAPPVAAIVAGLTTSLFLGRLAVVAVPVFLIYGYVVALVLGLPAYLVLRFDLRRARITYVIIGVVVALLPWLLLEFAGSGSATRSLSVNDVDYIVDGVRTAAWWNSLAVRCSVVIGTGAFAGLVFRGCLYGESPHYRRA